MHKSWQQKAVETAAGALFGVLMGFACGVAWILSAGW